VALRERAGFGEPEEGWDAPREGRDGWLFLRGDTNDALGQHTGRVVLDREQARRWRRVWRGRARLTRRIGAAHLQLVVPDKEAVYAELYAELLPPGAALALRRPVHRLLELAQRLGIDLVYPLDEMRAEHPAGPMFAKTDSHWTAIGAYVSYLRVCEVLEWRGVRVPVVTEDKFEWEDFEFAGDLGFKFSPPRLSTGVRARVHDPRARLIADNRVRVTGRRLVFESDRHAAPRIVVFGTSSVLRALPFLAETASRLVFVHTTSVVREVLVEERPDVVIVISAERLLVRPPADRGAGEMLAATAAQKTERGVLAPDRDLEEYGIAPLETAGS
jgi:hypothetical protein